MSILIDREVITQIAAEGYKNYNIDQESFKKDVHQFFVVRKMIRRFLTTGTINHKLIINNIIICLNVFGIQKTNVIYRTICDDQEFGVVKACLIFLKSFRLNDHTEQHRIMKDILEDIKYRYCLEPREGSNERHDHSLHTQPID
jgi:hypothetical protein